MDAFLIVIVIVIVELSCVSVCAFVFYNNTREIISFLLLQWTKKMIPLGFRHAFSRTTIGNTP